MPEALPADFLASEPSLLRHLLSRRGITDEKLARRLLAPDYERDLFDPFLMKGMKEAAARICEAVKQEEKITIYGDYDCDGCAAATVLADFFRQISFNNFEVYIPNREEGYGLNKEAIVKLAQNKTNLLITVDCGIANYEEVEFAKGLGMEVIVTDHHLPPEILPRCIVVNPKQPGCIYPEKMLCGAGVAFKLVQALQKFLPLPRGQEKWLLDLVALATLADSVPLRGENRALAYFGLKVLNRTRRLGLAEMFKALRLRRLLEDDVTFSIIPRLNSLSRLGEPTLVFEMLATSDPGQASLLAKKVESTNKERKNLVLQTMRQAKDRLSEREPKDIIVIGDPHWPLGILGLLANKLVEEYGRPAFVWTRVGDLVKGSCRTTSFNLVRLMKEAPAETFVSFGGHEQAGGFVVNLDQIVGLEENLLQSLPKEEAIVEEEFTSDGILDLGEVSRENLRIIDRLRPFGNSFAKPVFLFQNLTVTGARRFGQSKNHLSLSLADSHGKIEAIRFFEKREDFPETVSILASPEEDFAGRPRLRIEKFL